VASDLLVEGALLDVDGARPGYALFRDGLLTETGSVGTASAGPGVRTVRGIVVPAPVNGHTHLGDAVATREPPHTPISEIVRPPNGYKFRLLQETPAAEKRRAMRAALDRMAREGVAATVDFREEGLPGVRMLRAAARGLPIRAVALGRPLRRPVERRELDALLEHSDGIGLSAIGEESREVRTIVSAACRAKGKWYALHASESNREDPEEYLDPRPDLLDLEQRMNWLSAGPYGNRAGDILLLPRACMNVPIEKRFYFAGITHYTWHGSACEQDGHVPFILAHPSETGAEMRSIMSDFGGDSPSERELTPLVRSLFPYPVQAQSAAARPTDGR